MDGSNNGSGGHKRDRSSDDVLVDRRSRARYVSPDPAVDDAQVSFYSFGTPTPTVDPQDTLLSNAADPGLGYQNPFSQPVGAYGQDYQYHGTTQGGYGSDSYMAGQPAWGQSAAGRGGYNQPTAGLAGLTSDLMYGPADYDYGTPSIPQAGYGWQSTGGYGLDSGLGSSFDQTLANQPAYLQAGFGQPNSFPDSFVPGQGVGTGVHGPTDAGAQWASARCDRPDSPTLGYGMTPGATNRGQSTDLICPDHTGKEDEKCPRCPSNVQHKKTTKRQATQCDIRSLPVKRQRRFDDDDDPAPRGVNLRRSTLRV